MSERQCKFCHYDLLTSETEVCADCLDSVTSHARRLLGGKEGGT